MSIILVDDILETRNWLRWSNSNRNPGDCPGEGHLGASRFQRPTDHHCIVPWMWSFLGLSIYQKPNQVPGVPASCALHITWAYGMPPWEVRHAAVLWEVPVSVPLAAAGRLFVWWTSETLAIFSRKGPGPAGPPDEALKAELKKQNEEEEVATSEWKHHETWWKHGASISERALSFFGLRLSQSRQRSEIIHRFFLQFRRGFRRGF